ncbi:hypothetical protein CUMW_250780 [Citrus unshiu]|uniref:BHLH domain-containing protein n=1 Tax=Citrus unshiu TaxID=55188 RepID=A0A2H5QPZ4_CITUN|nr:hypothetical protein CUMW_250780 [Citrus unshiu]
MLELGRPPKTDKATILSDVVRMMEQLRTEAQKLKQLDEDLQEKIKELKAEKNELRDEKQRLKADKEKLEQQVKAMSAPSGFLPHPSSINKLVPFIGYPGVAMWQFMPPVAVDTSQDHVLRPPDVSDAQWRNFRSNLTILTMVFTLFAVLANTFRTFFNLKKLGKVTIASGLPDADKRQAGYGTVSTRTKAAYRIWLNGKSVTTKNVHNG